MRAILLIAFREYRQYVMTRGFWLSLLMFPIFLGLGATIPQFLEGASPQRHYVLVDRTGIIEDQVEAAFERDYQRTVLQGLSIYLRGAVEPEALQQGRIPPLYLTVSVGAAEVTAFIEAGGIEAALDTVAPYLREGVPPYTVPRRRFVRVDLPEAIDANAPLDEIADALAPYLMGNREVRTPDGEKELFAAILIPEALAGETWSAETVQYWSTNIADDALRDRFAAILNEELRQREYGRRGIDPSTIAAVERQSASVRSFDPRKEETGGRISLKDRIEQVIPYALTYLLWVGIFTVANILLTNVIEEKSNKIIEVLLSSVTAHELMFGKLIGILGVGLTTISFWIGGSVLVFSLLPGDVSQIGPPIVDLFLSTPLLPFFLFYFLAGYVMFAAVFLGVGSMCNSMSDAQTYMGPLILILFVPLITLTIIPRDPNGLIATVMSWVPIYTPFTMMMRISADPPLFDVIGTAIWVIVTAGFILWLMGRLFRNSVLRTGQPPKISEIFRLLRMNRI